MYKQIDFQIQGISPLILHNGRILTNPLNPLTKMIKGYTGKRTKTDDDLMAISKLEWLAGLYLDEVPTIDDNSNGITFSGGSAPIIPGDVLEGMIVSGAKKSKLGVQFKSGVLIDGDFPLLYDGPTDLEKLFNDGRFVDSRNVRVQKNAVVRCRPIFKQWAIKFTVNYLPSVVNPSQIKETLVTAGLVCGFCDYRPKYGRFAVV